MDYFYHLQITFIHLFQSLGDWLILPMKFFTFLGKEEFYLLIMPAIYWCINPALGLRSIRLCLTPQGKPVFKEQIRGLLRASVHGNLRIMFPMISNLAEIRAAKQVVEECKQELMERSLPFNPDVKLGIMVEMPSAALTADLLAREVDFFSVGTNDLIQYSLAVDRVNEHVGYLYEPLHPAILRLIRFVAEAGRSANIPVAMCGEMPAEPLFALVLVGLGLSELSMNATAIPMVKSILRASTYKEARGLVDEALNLASADEIESLLRDHMARRFSDLPGQAPGS